MGTHTWTPSQAAAIAAEPPALVTAAAGSGKTSVLTARIVRLLASGELDPAGLLAVTFTEKAAQEMRTRIADGLLQLGRLDLLTRLELAQLGTIHGLCATLVRSWGAAIGVDPGVGVLDEHQDAWLGQRAALDAIAAVADDPDVHLLRSRAGDGGVVTLLTAVRHAAARVPGAPVKIAGPDATGELPEGIERTAGAGMLRALQRIVDEHDRRIDAARRELGRISFDDLERYALELVAVPAVRAAAQARWTTVLVDEFQDTNATQFSILEAVAGDRLFCVGDEWQSIYRFRGADVDVFRTRRSEAGERVLPMRENFRSRARILALVNRAFGHEAVFGAGYEHVVAGTQAQHVDEPAVELLVVPGADLPDAPTRVDGLPAREREAARVAERMAELIRDERVDPGQIAVLYPSHVAAGPIEQALRAWGIPSLRAAADGFYDQPDVVDALAVLALVRNRADDRAALEVLAGPLLRLEWHELHQLASEAREAGITLAARMVDSRDEHVRAVAELVAGLADRARDQSLVALVDAIASLPGLLASAASGVDADARVANLRRLVELASSAQGVGVSDVGGFLEFIDAQRRNARVGEAATADEATGAVRLMTVHGAKGLEFDHVFVVDAGAGGGGGRRLPSLLRDHDGLLHVPLPDAGGRWRRAERLAVLDKVDQGLEDDERRRLWYVALTRARTRLYICGTWEFAPTAKGTPRARKGAFRWLLPALGLPDPVSRPGIVEEACDGLVVLDSRSARADPERVWEPPPPGVVRLATPLVAPDRAAGAEGGRDDDIEPGDELLERLRDGLDDGMAADARAAGTTLHDQLARLLADGAMAVETPAGVPSEHAQQLVAVLASTTWRELVARGARAEVPYVAAGPSGTSDAGRIDALVVDGDGWWIVDWKLTLPLDEQEAWARHSRQLRRYAEAARAAGAATCTVTLVPVDRPDEALTTTALATDTRELRLPGM